MIVDVNAIATFLANAGLAAGTTGWPIQKLVAQDEPDQVVVIYATGGPGPEQATEKRRRQPSFQIMTRGNASTGPEAASAKAGAILLALDRATIPGFKFFRATQSTPITIGTDEQIRHRFTVSFRAGES